MRRCSYTVLFREIAWELRKEAAQIKLIYNQYESFDMKLDRFIVICTGTTNNQFLAFLIHVTFWKWQAYIW
jgi:hypothetical protein